MRRVAVRVTAATPASDGTGAAEPGAVANERVCSGAGRDAMEDGEMLDDIALDGPRRERDVTRAVTSDKQAHNIGRAWSRRLDRLVLMSQCGMAVLTGGLIAKRDISIDAHKGTGAHVMADMNRASTGVLSLPAPKSPPQQPSPSSTTYAAWASSGACNKCTPEADPAQGSKILELSGMFDGGE
jgi:hypothetical protein